MARSSNTLSFYLTENTHTKISLAQGLTVCSEYVKISVKTSLKVSILLYNS